VSVVREAGNSLSSGHTDKGQAGYRKAVQDRGLPDQQARVEAGVLARGNGHTGGANRAGNSMAGILLS
jgi:hypothetical protein